MTMVLVLYLESKHVAPEAVLARGTRQMHVCWLAGWLVGLFDRIAFECMRIKKHLVFILLHRSYVFFCLQSTNSMV